MAGTGRLNGSGLILIRVAVWIFLPLVTWVSVSMLFVTLGVLGACVVTWRPSLADLERSVRERRLQQWHDRITNDIKYASKWLKSRNKPQNVQINVQGDAVPDPNRAVQHLRNFWTSFWKESDETSPRDQDSWVPPTAIMMKAQAMDSHGLELMAGQEKSLALYPWGSGNCLLT
eukprot:s1171_g11.t1